MKAQLTEATARIMGSGWGALVWEPMAKRLATVQIHDHQSNVAQGSVPLLVIDAWEHAYYLEYQNRKLDFFKAVWSLWNWDDVAARFARASAPQDGKDESHERQELSGEGSWTRPSP